MQDNLLDKEYLNTRNYRYHYPLCIYSVPYTWYLIKNVWVHVTSSTFVPHTTIKQYAYIVIFSFTANNKW